MIDEKKLIDLLVRRDSLQAQGQVATPEQVCEDCPELIKEFQVELQSLQATDWIFDTDVEEEEDVPPSHGSRASGELTLPKSSLSPRHFVQAIAISGLLTVGEIDAFRKAHPESTKSTDSLARELVLQGKLTRYQASVLLTEQIAPLLLDRYVILDKLGSGGMGHVFKALHRPLDRIVALKTLPASAVDSPEKVRRFRREGKAAAMLAHPNIITTYDADQSDGVAFLVMEYVPGQDLQKTVQQEGPLSVATAVDYVLQVARGLEHAHGLGIVHRDIKPGNLLLDPTGTVKILDLGLARLEQQFGGPATPDEAAPETVGIMGTAAYMSPEQAANPHQADCRADIYSLGCTLHFLLTGHPPYPQETLVNTVFAHRDKPIPLLNNERKNVSDELLAVYRRMMAKSPEDRYGSMREVIEALLGCGSVQRDASETGTVDLADLDTATVGPDKTIVDPEQTAARASRRRWWIMGAVAVAFLAAGFLGAILVKIHTPAGTVIVELNEPDVEIIVDAGKVQIVGAGQSQMLEIEVDAGKHTLTASKRGFQTRRLAFTINSGDREVLQVTLLPLASDKAKRGNSRAASPDIASWRARAAERKGQPPPLAVAPCGPQQAREHQQAWADYLDLPLEWTNSLGMQFVLVPPGAFLMGSTHHERSIALASVTADATRFEAWIAAERPPHQVRISQPFYLGKHEVTQAQWEAAMGVNPSVYSDPSGPVDNVSWHDVQIFLKINGVDALSIPRLRKSLGASQIRFTLPTEAQWEYACRAGTTTAYNSGASEEMLSQHGWFRTNSDDRTHAAGQLAPNAWGLHDMHGNVWEWCADWFAGDYYTPTAQIDPQGPASGSVRVFRGGCYGYDACFCRSAFRRGLAPNSRYQSLGFRLAALLDEPDT